jgi:hypothetical protein
MTAAFLIVVAAAVGGGVGGALATHKSNDGADAAAAQSTGTQTSTASSPSAGTASSTSSGASSTTPSHSDASSASPTHKPYANFELRMWEGFDYQGEMQVFYHPGGYNLGFKAKSYSWDYDTSYNISEEDVCSVAFCRAATEVGWHGSTPSDQPGYPTAPDTNVDNIFIGCGHRFTDPGCKLPRAMSTFRTVPTITSTPGS